MECVLSMANISNVLIAGDLKMFAIRTNGSHTPIIKICAYLTGNRKHIFSDLRPYICTFEGCGLNMFESQHQWFNHELRFHRKLWTCTFCKELIPQSRPDLEAHMRNIHVELVQENNIETLLDTCAIVRIDATCCPLCTTYGSRLQSINQSSKCDVSLKQFQEHLGRHMEQLALAALPEEDDHEDAIADEDEVTGSYIGRVSDLESIYSRPATWGTRRRSSPSVADIEGQPVEKKPGFLNTLFRRRKKEPFDDSEFKHGKALDFPDIPGEAHRNSSLAQIRDEYSEGKARETKEGGKDAESNAIAGSRASIHSTGSVASTVLTRASSIILVEYIPGVTNRDSSPTVIRGQNPPPPEEPPDPMKPLPPLPSNAFP